MERPDILANPRSERVRKVASLSGRSARQRHGQFLVEGPSAVLELLRHRPDLVRDVYLTQASAARQPELAQTAAHAHLVTPQVAQLLSSDSQGVVAVARALPSAPVSAVAGARLVAVLPQIQDPGNLGTLIRVADAAGADAVVVGKGSADVMNPKVVRATTGSLFHLPVITAADVPEALAACRAGGLTVVAADAGGEDVSAADWLAQPTAWMFGNEAHGLSAHERALADRVAAIPLYGRAESLNVAAAAAVCLYASAMAARR